MVKIFFTTRFFIKQTYPFRGTITLEAKPTPKQYWLLGDREAVEDLENQIKAFYR